jgi:hypothetical protein
MIKNSLISSWQITHYTAGTIRRKISQKKKSGGKMTGSPREWRGYLKTAGMAPEKEGIKKHTAEK